MIIDILIIAGAIIGIVWILSAKASRVKLAPQQDPTGDDESHYELVIEDEPLAPANMREERSQRKILHDLGMIDKQHREQTGWYVGWNKAREDDSVIVVEEETR